MNYSALIEGRRSVRAFLDKAVPEELILEILEYHDKSCKRLAPDIDTALLILDESSQSALEGTAGYKQFLIGAPHYLLLLSDRGPHMGLNAGYMMEDMILKPAVPLGIGIKLRLHEGERRAKLVGGVAGKLPLGVIGPGYPYQHLVEGAA